MSSARPLPMDARRLVPGAKRTDIGRAYDIRHRVLGSGTSSVVRVAVNRTTGEEVAVKEIDKALAPNLAHIANEVRLLRKVANDKERNHDGIVRLLEVFESDTHVYIVMELLQGGELFDRLRGTARFTEKDAADIIRQVLRACAYLHASSIVHRDIKPANILFAADDARGTVRGVRVVLIDLGLSKLVGESGTKTPCGTPAFLAPEMISGAELPYNNRIDVWAAGCILYTLLSGLAPFHRPDESIEQMLDSVRAGVVQFPSPNWDSVSEAAKDAVTCLLRVDPHARVSAAAALQHPWIAGKRSASATALVTPRALQTRNIEPMLNAVAGADEEPARIGGAVDGALWARRQPPPVAAPAAGYALTPMALSRALEGPGLVRSVSSSIDDDSRSGSPSLASPTAAAHATEPSESQS